MRNKVQLIGFLGQKPEQKTLQGNKMLTSFSLATNEKRKTSDGNYETQTEWHSMKAWGKRGEFAAQYLEKGDEIAIEGSLHYYKYEDKNGNKRSGAEIVVKDIMLIRKKNGGNHGK